MNSFRIKTAPDEIFEEYSAGDSYKQGLGKRGITEQGRINERFYVGDQWYGARCGNSRPLVRRNLIKRIGEYKMSTITATPITVNFSADGVADIGLEAQKEQITAELQSGRLPEGRVGDAEVSTVMNALSEYFKTTAERVRLDTLNEQALRNSYISGTGILYTYWDSSVNTGLYADKERFFPIKGDISCEVLDIENVVFGEPNNDDLQTQPYIIISRRQYIGDVIRRARRNGVPEQEIINIVPDSGDYYNKNQGGYSEEPDDSLRVTTMTKFYKVWNKAGTDFTVMCTECTEKTVIRKPFDMGIKLYPFAIMPWERRRSCIYGESEITYLVPNQIAINRCLTAAVWGMISTGMPITVINGDIVTDPITNEPGQIIKVYGSNEDVAGAIRHINPPIFEEQYFVNINEMALSTLSDSGATDAALGTMTMNNATAIIQLREAAIQPMRIYMNRFYGFVEQLARIWAEFWINLYGVRKLKSVTGKGVNYIPFDGSRYRDLVISARIDVGAANLWSEAVVVSALDKLLEKEFISIEQYLDRLPAGIVPDVTGLKEDLRLKNSETAENSDERSL